MLVHVSQEQLTALMACLHAAATNCRLEGAIYVRIDDPKRMIRYGKAIELMAELLEQMSDNS